MRPEAKPETALGRLILVMCLMVIVVKPVAPASGYWNVIAN